MKRKQFRSTIILSVILIFTGSGLALAHEDGYRSGDRDDSASHRMDYDGGYGGHGMEYDGGYNGHMMDLNRGYHDHMMGPDDDAYGAVHHTWSRNEYSKLENAREKYYHKTNELQKKMDDKRHAIEREMDKVNPNRRKIKALEKELAALRAQFDQYSVDYDRSVHEALNDSAHGRAYAGGFRGGYGW
jgi:hypothetical protein